MTATSKKEREEEGGYSALRGRKRAKEGEETTRPWRWV